MTATGNLETGVAPSTPATALAGTRGRRVTGHIIIGCGVAGITLHATLLWGFRSISIGGLCLGVFSFIYGFFGVFSHRHKGMLILAAGRNVAAIFEKSPGIHDEETHRINGMVYRDRTARKAHVITYMVLSIINALASSVGLGFAIRRAVDDFYLPYTGMLITTAVILFVQTIVSIVGAAYTCSPLKCCCCYVAVGPETPLTMTTDNLPPSYAAAELPSKVPEQEAHSNNVYMDQM